MKTRYVVLSEENAKKIVFRTKKSALVAVQAVKFFCGEDLSLNVIKVKSVPVVKKSIRLLSKRLLKKPKRYADKKLLKKLFG